MKRKPNLFIVGAQKCASTSLKSWLNQHPDVFLSYNELHFFSNDDWEDGLQKYLDVFNGKTERYVGEKTPEYFHTKRIPPRIAKVAPDAKIIILVRNPADRAYSAYWFWRSHGKFPLVINSFEDSFFKSKHDWGQMRHIGKYSQHIRNYYDHFPKENILILKVEDFKKNPQVTLENVCKFLQLTPIIFDTTQKRNQTVVPQSKLIMALLLFRWIIKVIRKFGMKRTTETGFLIKAINISRRCTKDKHCRKGYPPMNKKTRQKLNKYYESYNNELYQLTGIKWSKEKSI